MRRLLVGLSAILLPAVVLLSFTPNIIMANARDIPFTTHTLYVVWAAFGLSSLLFVVAALARERFIVLSTCLTANILIWNAAFSAVWLDSGWLLASAIAVEVGVFALSHFLLSRVSFVLVTRAAAIATLLIVAFSVPTHRSLLASLPAPEEAKAGPYRADIPPPSNALPVDGNVYHIVLDAFAAPYMSKRINEGSVNLAGYTFYPNATANYGRTNLSMRSVFAGSFHPYPITKWDTVFQHGFNDTLAQAGVPLTYFPFYDAFCDNRATVCHSTTRLYSSQRDHLETTFVLDVAFQSLLPVSMRDYGLNSLEQRARPTESWEYGFSITSFLMGLFQGKNEIYPIQSLTMDTLQDFFDNEEKLPPSRRYTFIHLMVPHGPYIFDSHCDIIPPQDRPADDDEVVEGQFGCAVTAIEKITSKLQQLGRFDKSLVIFHADHGLGIPERLSQWDPAFVIDGSGAKLERDVADLSAMSADWVKSLSTALLLVHFPGQRDFRTDSENAQLIDVGPTVLRYFGKDPSELQGFPLGSVPAERQQVYYESSTDQLGKLERLARFVKKDGAWSFDAWDDVGPRSIEPLSRIEADADRFLTSPLNCGSYHDLTKGKAFRNGLTGYNQWASWLDSNAVFIRWSAPACLPQGARVIFKVTAAPEQSGPVELSFKISNTVLGTKLVAPHEFGESLTFDMPVPPGLVHRTMSVTSASPATKIQIEVFDIWGAAAQAD